MTKVEQKKGQIWISAVLYFLIATVIITIMLEAGMPLVDQMKDKSIFSQTKNQFIEISQQIRDISAEGEGSKRIIPIQIKKGELSVDNQKLQWEMDTKAKILEPRSVVKLGDLTISSDNDVSAEETGTTYTLENSLIKATLRKYGSKDNWVSISPSDILISLYDKKTETQTTGTFTINTPFLTNMYGYSEISAKGDNLGDAEVTYYVCNSTNTTATQNAIKFTLLSKTDFLKVDLE